MKNSHSKLRGNRSGHRKNEGGVLVVFLSLFERIYSGIKRIWISIYPAIKAAFITAIPVLTLLVTYQQLRVQEVQTEVAASVAKLEKTLSPPIVGYMRTPPFSSAIVAKDGFDPSDALYPHRFPEKAYITLSNGYASLKTVASVYYGNIRYKANCKGAEEVTACVGFSEQFVIGNGTRKVAGLPTHNFHMVVSDDLERRVREFENAVSAQLGGCVSDTRIDGSFKVTFVTHESQEATRYLAGYMGADPSMVTEADHERNVQDYLSRVNRGCKILDVASAVSCLKEKQFNPNEVLKAQGCQSGNILMPIPISSMAPSR